VCVLEKCIPDKSLFVWSLFDASAKGRTLLAGSYASKILCKLT